MGWFGMSDQVQHVLRTMGADRDEDGKFVVAGTVASLMGLGQEVVIGDDAVYFVDGQPRSLASAMNGTSYGLRGITVI